MIFSNLCQAQLVELIIEVRADANPSEISWTLYDNDNNVVITDDEQIIDPFELYSKSVSVDVTDCFRFEIKDTGGDGIVSPGSYKVKYDGEYIFDASNNFSTIAEHYINCPQIGNSCINAEPVYLNEMRSPVRENNWYVYNSPTDIFININTCANIDNSLETLDSDIWVYDSCPTNLSDGPEGALTFIAEYPTCAPAAALLGFKITANKDYYIRVKTHDLNWLNDLIVQFTKAPDRYGCTNPQACNFDPFANVEDNNCIVEECLPDLAILQTNLYYSVLLDTITNNDECYIEEGCLTGMGLRDIVRFETAIENVGDADYVIGVPSDNPDAFSNDNCHEHWHQLGYAEYLLYAGAGEPQPIGFKNGFCVLDLFCPDQDDVKYHCGYMGLSAGCKDIYDITIDCQWIDVTDVPDGDYTLVARINWTEQLDLRGKSESNYENNWAQVCFNLDRSSGKLVLTLNDDCESYTDCFGNEFGPAVVDCNGDCGGGAHFGDINNDLLLNDADITKYLEAIAWDQAVASTCLDLDGNGQLNIYDAALMRECIEATEGETVADHSHCLFPAGYTNVNQSVWVQLQEFDDSNQSIDFEYFSPSNELFAFDVLFSGVKIASVEPMANSEMEIFWNDNRVIAMTKPNNQLPKNTEMNALLSINVSEVTDQEICIANVNDIVNKNYEKTVIGFGESCRFAQVTALDQIDLNPDLKLYPNPADDVLWLNFKDLQEIEKVELISADGSIFNQNKNNVSNTGKIDTSHLPNGIYFLKIVMNNKQSISGKVLVSH